MVGIVKATSNKQFKIIEELAHTIWHEHYITIITLEQITYMLEKYNTVDTIAQRVKEGALFFYMTFDDVPVGYLGIEKKTNYVYISKLYVLKSYRGKKIAKTAMLFAESIALETGISTMKLHVNKYNTNSILAYEKMGYVNTESMVTDIGKGFVMDDYLMVKMI